MLNSRNKATFGGLGIAVGSRVAQAFVGSRVASFSPMLGNLTGLILGLGASYAFYRSMDPRKRQMGMEGFTHTVAANLDNLLSLVGMGGLGNSYAMEQVAGVYDYEQLNGPMGIDLLSQGDSSDYLPDLLEMAPMAANYGNTLVG